MGVLVPTVQVELEPISATIVKLYSVPGVSPVTVWEADVILAVAGIAGVPVAVKESQVLLGESVKVISVSLTVAVVTVIVPGSENNSKVQIGIKCDVNQVSLIIPIKLLSKVQGYHLQGPKTLPSQYYFDLIHSTY